MSGCVTVRCIVGASYRADGSTPTASNIGKYCICWCPLCRFPSLVPWCPSAVIANNFQETSGSLWMSCVVFVVLIFDPILIQSLYAHTSFLRSLGCGTCQRATWLIKGNSHIDFPWPDSIDLDSVVKFSLTWAPFTWSMALDAYHIDSVNTCYD